MRLFDCVHTCACVRAYMHECPGVRAREREGVRSRAGWCGCGWRRRTGMAMTMRRAAADVVDSPVARKRAGCEGSLSPCMCRGGFAPLSCVRPWSGVTHNQYGKHTVRRMPFATHADPDTGAWKIGQKIRHHLWQEKIPMVALVGDKEFEEGTVTVRSRTGGDLGTMTLAAFGDMLEKMVKDRQQ